MIDCLSAFITWLGSDADLNTQTAGRIAAKHKFGMVESGGWPTPAKALQLTYDGGGTPDVRAGMERARLEARCYGASQVEASAVYNRLIALCETFQRCTVSTGDGLALLYYLVPDTSGGHDREPLGESGIDMVRVFLQAAAHHESV